MKIFTTKQLQSIFNKTNEVDASNGIDFTERIASSVAYEIISRWRPNKRFILFAGPGNNGCISLAVAKTMLEQGYHLEVFLFNITSMPISKACAENRDRLKGLPGLDFTEVTTTFEMPYINDNDVVIDGLFGSGISEPLKGGFTALVQHINASEAYIVSIDMPSGLMCEWNLNNDRRNIIRASLTLAFQFKHLSFFFSENAEFIGECRVLDIDLNNEAIRRTDADFAMIEKRDFRSRIRHRDEFSNKYTFGSVLLATGSYGMMGAAVLSARSALRSGAGLISVHTPRCGFSILQSSVPEAINQYDVNNTIISDIREDRNFDCIAVGPGIGTDDVTVNAIDSFLKRQSKPCVIDADALNCIAKRPALLDSIPNLSVITPHAGEFDRLFGKHPNDESRLRDAINIAHRYSIVILLKGRYTMIVRPDKKVYINSTGNPGMATPGSGDVLTGLIAGFIAQGYTSEWSAAFAAFVHGCAGDMATAKLGTYSVTASDIIDNIGPCLNELMK